MSQLLHGIYCSWKDDPPLPQGCHHPPGNVLTCSLTVPSPTGTQGPVLKDPTPPVPHDAQKGHPGQHLRPQKCLHGPPLCPPPSPALRGLLPLICLLLWFLAVLSCLSFPCVGLSWVPSLFFPSSLHLLPSFHPSVLPVRVALLCFLSPPCLCASSFLLLCLPRTPLSVSVSFTAFMHFSWSRCTCVCLHVSHPPPPICHVLQRGPNLYIFDKAQAAVGPRQRHWVCLQPSWGPNTSGPAVGVMCWENDRWNRT